MPAFCRSWCCNYTFCQSEGENIKRPNYANRPVIRSMCLRSDLLSLTCICLCAVFGAPGLHIKSLVLSSGLHTIQPPTLERRDVWRAVGCVCARACACLCMCVQQHQITNNFPICIFLRMVQHLCLMHLPVHPTGAAELKEACDSRHLLKDVSEIGTLCEYKIHESDNQSGLET